MNLDGEKYHFSLNLSSFPESISSQSNATLFCQSWRNPVVLCNKLPYMLFKVRKNVSLCFRDTCVSSLHSSCYSCIWAEAESVYSPAIRNTSFKPPVAKLKMSWNVQQPGRQWKCEVVFHLQSFGIRFWQGHVKRVCLSDSLKMSCWCRLLHRPIHTILLQSVPLTPLRFWIGQKQGSSGLNLKQDETGLE